MIENIDLTVVLAADAAANNTDVDSLVVDMAGFDGCIFFVPIVDSVATGVASLIAEGGAIANLSDAKVLVGGTATETSAADDDLNGKYLVVDVKRPLQRYLRVNLKSATANIAYGETHALRYRARKSPVTQASIPHPVEVVGPALTA